MTTKPCQTSRTIKVYPRPYAAPRVSQNSCLVFYTMQFNNNKPINLLTAQKRRDIKRVISGSVRPSWRFPFVIGILEIEVSNSDSGDASFCSVDATRRRRKCFVSSSLLWPPPFFPSSFLCYLISRWKFNRLQTISGQN